MTRRTRRRRGRAKFRLNVQKFVQSHHRNGRFWLGTGKRIDPQEGPRR